MGLEVRGAVETYFLVGQKEIIIDVTIDEVAAGEAEVVNLQGQVLITTPVRSGKQAIATDGLSKGIYLVRTKVAGLPLTVKKLMVQ